MDFYKKIWNERKKELLDKIGKAPNQNVAARDIEELTSMIRLETSAYSGDEQKKDGKMTVGIRAVCITPAIHVTGMTSAEDAFQELIDAAMPMKKFLDKYFDPHTTAYVSEGGVTIVRDEMSTPLTVRD